MSGTPKTDAFEALLIRPVDWWDFARDLERENAALREQVEHLIKMIEQLEGDLAHFASIEAFETKKEAQP